MAASPTGKSKSTEKTKGGAAAGGKRRQVPKGPALYGILKSAQATAKAAKRIVHRPPGEDSELRRSLQRQLDLALELNED